MLPKKKRTRKRKSVQLPRQTQTQKQSVIINFTTPKPRRVKSRLSQSNNLIGQPMPQMPPRQQPIYVPENYIVPSNRNPDYNLLLSRLELERRGDKTKETALKEAKPPKKSVLRTPDQLREAQDLFSDRVRFPQDSNELQDLILQGRSRRENDNRLDEMVRATTTPMKSVDSATTEF